IVTVPIPKDVSGPVTIKFENIDKNEFAAAEFLTSIEKPAVRSTTFPIKLASALPDSKEGSFNIDLTWFPSTITTNEQTEFVLTVKDKTDRPIPQSSFGFVILQKGKEIFRQNAAAPAGGTYVDYTFSKEQEGPTTLRIENINHSNEAVELTVVVTPEFPISLSVFLAAFGIILLVQLRYSKLRFA
ncbi:MAG TPA: hypothetical protein VLF17_07420, partial [Candidatus Nitrosotenuis sp.]|nr:hypothetical protein [Candidatus Nitrosotenuis sp.]